MTPLPLGSQRNESVMIDITLANLEADLIGASRTQPVLLDIWAPWCGPCKTLGPVLEKLEVAYAGRFKLAKLNADEQPEIAGQLSQMFGVRSIPFCVLFADGQPLDGFVGALPESEVRGFLDKHVPSAEEEAAAEEVDEARELLAAGDADEALSRLFDAVEIDPKSTPARVELLRALLQLGRTDEARAVYAPVANPVLQDAKLAACGHWLAAQEAASAAQPASALEAALVANKRDFDARFALAQLHFATGQFTEALDALLEIILRDRAWHDELARKTYVAILELMTKPPTKPGADAPQGKLEVAGRFTATPADPVLDAYRRKLSMALF